MAIIIAIFKLPSHSHTYILYDWFLENGII